MTTRETVKQIIAEMFFVDTVNAGDRLREDLSVDSLHFSELLVAIEETLDIEFDAAELSPAKLLCVEDIVLLTERYAGGESVAV